MFKKGFAKRNYDQALAMMGGMQEIQEKQATIEYMAERAAVLAEQYSDNMEILQRILAVNEKMNDILNDLNVITQMALEGKKNLEK